jgi:hypothetical protein
MLACGARWGAVLVEEQETLTKHLFKQVPLVCEEGKVKVELAIWIRSATWMHACAESN